MGWGQKIKKLTKAILDAHFQKPCARAFRLWDDYFGLYAEISPRGMIRFAMKYRRGGKERRESIGRYNPDAKLGVTLEEARRKVRQVRAQLDRGFNPHAPAPSLSTFDDASRAWLAQAESRLAPRTMTQVRRYLKACTEAFGKKAIDRIQPQDVLDVLRKFEARGAIESAKRARIYAHEVFDMALPMEATNPASSERLKKKLAKRPKVTHHAAMPAKAIPGFLEQLAAAQATHPSIRGALAFTALTALRTGEIIGLQWSEIAEDGASLTISGDRMKAGEPHTVFLSRQARALLEEIRPFSGKREYVFPGRNPKRPLSNMAMLGVLTNLAPGFTVHGLRSSFSTWAHAKGAAPKVVERCLAHASADKVAAAYNHHTYDREAAKLWQQWADAIAGAAK